MWAGIFHLICTRILNKTISILGISDDCQVVTVLTAEKGADDRSKPQILRNRAHKSQAIFSTLMRKYKSHGSFLVALMIKLEALL